jgi:alkanesulfonate monooxygenase SsuD/methylene tetrahydromethanopterin reductase-like flavin-dependent oxidoreductase (luciferase family)
VGVGWQRAEYDAAGLDFSARGQRLDHTLEVCQTLWREQRATFDSPELRFEAIHTMPKPFQPGGVPLWISGTVNPRVVSRLARFGTGWIPWGPAAADVANGIRQMKDALAEAGRDPGRLQVVGSLPLARDGQGGLDVARTVEAVPRLAGAGVTDFRVAMRLPAGHSAALDQLSALADAFHEASRG